VAEDQSGAVAALAALRNELGKHPELRSYQQVVRDLAKQVAASDGQQNGSAKAADGWADLDLIAALGIGAPLPASVAAPLPVPVVAARLRKQPWWRTVIDALPPVLVFVPILLTWLSLFAASNAYRSLEASSSARTANAGKSFLELWQQGFAGRLPTLLSFGYVAMYTVTAVTLLIVMTALGGYFRRRDEEAEEVAQHAAEQAQVAAHAAAERARVTAEREHQATEQARVALLPALVRAQAELNKYRLGTPARFGAELSQAAIGLRALLADTSDTQDSALKLAQQNQQLSEKLGEYALETREITGELQSAAGLMRTAADALANANSVLATEVTGRIEASAGRLDQASGHAAARVDELVQVGQASLDGITDRFDAAMTGIRAQVDATTAAMIDAGDRYAAAISESSGEAAAKIVDVYQEAVASAACVLVTEMDRATSELSGILIDVGRSAQTQADAAVRTEEAVTAHAKSVTTAADRISGAADNMSGAADNMSGAAQSMSGAADTITGVAATISSVAASVSGAVDGISDVAAGVSGVAESMSGVAASVSGAVDGISDVAAGVSGVADSVSGVAADVSGSSGALERVVAGYTSVQQQVADTLGRAADRLSAHAASLAERLAEVNAAQLREAADAADTDVVASDGEHPDLVVPGTATPDIPADLTGTEESP
jgi:hypothetical protein